MGFVPLVEEVTAYGRRFTKVQKALIKKEMDEIISGELDKEWGFQIRFVAWNIIQSVKKIQERAAGKRGPKPLSNLQIMQIWLYVQLQRLRHPYLPVQSIKSESVLNMLADQTVRLGSKKLRCTAKNWMRYLDMGEALIKANKELQNATSSIRSQVETEKLHYRQNRPDYEAYLRNQKKENRRLLRRNTRHLLENITDDDAREAIKNWIDSWLDTNKIKENREISRQLRNWLESDH